MDAFVNLVSYSIGVTVLVMALVGIKIACSRLPAANPPDHTIDAAEVKKIA